MTAAPRQRSSVEEVLVDFIAQRPLLGERLPVRWMSAAQKGAELQRVVAARAMLAAYEAELINGLADASPDTLDPPPGTPGAKKGSWSAAHDLPGVSEFFFGELSTVLNCGRGTASLKAPGAWTWRENLPATLAALRAGTLDEPRGAALADVLEHASPEAARAIEAELLPEAMDLSLGTLRRRALALLLARDAEAVDKRRKTAKRQADVRTYPSAREGMATLAAELSAEEAAACYDIVDQLATMLKADGDPRPIGELRAAVLADLIQHPWLLRPPVTANLQISATLGALEGSSARAGEVNGLVITAAHVRELLARVGALGPDGLQTPDGGSVTFALTDEHGALLATLTLDQLQRLARRGCREHPDGDCGCAVLDRPPPTDAYEPTDAQRAWVKTRDRTCRFPNCGQRVGWADLDHVIAHACGGPTACGNLCCLCRGHHRLKTFARGWRFVMTDDGVLQVTTPSGISRTTRPPGLRREPEPPTEPDPAPAEPDDDPPPF